MFGVFHPNELLADPASSHDRTGDNRTGASASPQHGTPRPRLTTHGGPPCCRVQVRGELDLATAPTLRRHVDDLREAGVRHLRLEVSELDFLAAAGLHVLAHADQLFRAAAGSLVLAHPPSRIRRLLALAGSDTLLTVYPTGGGLFPATAPDAPDYAPGQEGDLIDHESSDSWRAE